MYHDPALLNDVLEGLNVKSDGVYVDVTYGGGGHSMAILERLGESGKLFAFDQDPDAKANLIEDFRFQFIQQNFSFTRNYLRMYSVLPVDGLLADLGVSFHQFDEAGRGFSFRFEGPLDMRMDQSRNLTAAKILNTYEYEDLLRVFKIYGELKNASKVASKVVESRGEVEFKTTNQLREVLQAMVPQKVEHKFLAQVFQALRIEVNQELKVIEDLLLQLKEIVKAGGRIAVITYHSLEDRLVKNFIRTGNVEGKLEKDFYGNVKRPFEAINRKPIVASVEEVRRNNRSRSAKLRIAERVNESV